MLPRSLLALLAGSSLLFLVTACSRHEAAGGAGGKAPKILHYGNYGEPQDLDPQVVTGIPEHHLVAALFEGLVSEDPVDLHPVPGLAERWEISPDGLTYTFHLRPDGKWSDGTPLLASEVVESCRRMLAPALAAEYAYMLWYVEGAEAYNRGELTDFAQTGFQAPDEHTVVLKLRAPVPYLLKILASHYSWWPVPVKTIAQYGPIDRKTTPWTRAGRLVGNGPFRLKEWSPNQRIVVERNPHYWDAKAVKLDQIVFYPTENIPAEEAMFRNGQLHRTQELPLNKIETYRQEFPQALRIEPWLGVYFYRFNVGRPPFNDKRVRRALALAVDREALIANVTKGEQLPAYTVSYPGTAGYMPRARLTGGLEEARRLLAEAGYPEGRGFPTVELLYNTNENHRVIAEAIQQMWRQNLGIDIRLLNQEWKVYLDSQDNRDFWLQRAGWIADYVDPHVFLEIWTSDNLNNDTGWSNAEYDRLYREALAAKSQQERYEIYQRMDAILVDECPVLPIYHYTRVYALSPKVRGWHPTLLDNHPFKYVDLAE